MRGASFLVAVTFAAEIGDVRRFDNPRQLMGFLGLVPRERSTGETVRRSGLTLAGNRRARRVLVEAAWSYRHPARVSQTLQVRLEGLPKTVRDIAWRRRSVCAAAIAGSAPAVKKIARRDRRRGARDGRLSVGDQPSSRTGSVIRGSPMATTRCKRPSSDPRSCSPPPR